MQRLQKEVQELMTKLKNLGLCIRVQHCRSHILRHKAAAEIARKAMQNKTSNLPALTDSPYRDDTIQTIPSQ